MELTDKQKKIISNLSDHTKIFAKIPCTKCEGCGKVANSKDQEPWTAWMDLPVKSSAALVTGIVKPMKCPSCEGTGYFTVLIEEV